MDTKGTLNVSWAPGTRSTANHLKLQYISPPPEDDPENLDDHELDVADEVADTWRDTPGYERGLILWKICLEHKVDHHSIARHLAWRRARQLYQRR